MKKTREISLKIFFVLHSSDSIVVVTSVLGRNHAKQRCKDNLLHFRRRTMNNHDLMIFQDSRVYIFVLMILISCFEAFYTKCRCLVSKSEQELAEKPCHARLSLRMRRSIKRISWVFDTQRNKWKSNLKEIIQIAKRGFARQQKEGNRKY